jgi:glycerate kinase
MRVLVACDSFKESSSATQVCRSIARGLRELPFELEIDECPMADGGEGLLAAIGATLDLQRECVPVSDPIGMPCDAELAWVDATSITALAADATTNAHAARNAMPSERWALLEAASAIGLARVPRERRDPWLTSSYGLGQLLKHAITQGATRVIVGLGGTATVDAGVGLAQALGANFPGIPAFAGGGELARIATIDLSGLEWARRRCRLILAADVTNPLLGPRGAAHAFGPQKGASAAMVDALEAGISQFARQLHGACAALRSRAALATPAAAAHGAAAPTADGASEQVAAALPLHGESTCSFESAAATAGAGAAGGLGFALQQVFDTTTLSGVELVMNAIGFDRRVRDADLVITGEGRLDQSSFEGKVVSGVLARARTFGIPVLAIVGSNACSADELRGWGVTRIETLLEHAEGLVDSKARVNELLAAAATRVGASLLAAP